MTKTIRMNHQEFDIINKTLLLAGHKELSYKIIRESYTEDCDYLFEADEDEFDLIAKLLIIDDDYDTKRVGYNLVNDNK